MHSFIRSQLLAVLVAAVPAALPAANVLTVDCNRGDSVTEVVAGAVSGGTVVVNGTCHETVVIPPNLVDVIVDGQGLAIVNPPSTGTAARVPRHGFYVRGRMVTVRGFTITDADDGIHLSGPAHAVIDGNVIRSNSGRGIHLDKGSVAQIVNNTIESNGSHGIHVNEQSHARVGFLIPPEPSSRPNRIRNNRGDGIHVARGSTAWIVANTISNNGGSGVVLDRNAQADVVGNIISANAADGVSAAHNSGIHLSADGTPRREGANQTESGMPNRGAAIRCTVGSYVVGPIGSLRGEAVTMALDATCNDGVTSSRRSFRSKRRSN